MKVRSDIPVPDSINLPGRPPAYPFRTMSVGDCFPVEADKLKAVRMAAWRQNSNGGTRRYLVAAKGNNWYCWRIA